VSEERLDDMVTRVLTSWIKFGQNLKGPDAYPPTNLHSFDKSLDQNVNVQSNHAELIREIGAASIILLKNINNILPLQIEHLKTVAIIGENATAPGELNGCADHGCISGTVAQGWGSGTSNFPYLVDPLSAIQNKLRNKNVKIIAHLENKNLELAQVTSESADISIVFVMSNSGEN